MKKIFTILAFLTLFSASLAIAEEADRQDLVFFYSLTCDKCIHIKDDIMPPLEVRFKDKVNVVYKDIGDVENYKLLFEFKKRYSKDEKAVFPVLFLNGNFIDERDLKSEDLSGKIASFIEDSLGSAKAAMPAPKTSDLTEHFRTFTLFTVALAGFIDGINPCSFTVMVFFISFLSLQRYNKKTVIVSGCAFITASFMTYLAIGLGLFGPLYAIKGFRAVTGSVTMAVGAFSALLGAISLYDALIFLKTKRPEDSILKLPVFIKDKIHKLVGDGYRVGKDGQLSSSVGRNAFRIFFASLAIGFSISVLESVCTGQLYLPTIVFVLKTEPHKLQALFYLLAYNMMFIIPLVTIFLLALAGVSSQGFAAIFRKYFFVVKVLLAILFFALGASLVFAEESPAVKKQNTASETRIISQAPEPRRPNDQFYWDFGKVKEGVVLKHKFFIRNDSKDPLKIKQINSSCACTVSTVEKDIVPPGKKIPIDIQFNTKGYPGERTRYTYVHTDSQKFGIIVYEIRADVIKQ